VPEQQLDAAHVGSGLQQMRGKALPQRVRGDRLGDAAGPMRPLASLPNGIPGDRPTGMSPGNNHVLGCATLQYERVHRAGAARASHTGLCDPCLVDAQHHARTVDVVTNGAWPPKSAARSVGGCQDGAVLDVVHRRQEVDHLLRTQHDRQLNGFLGIGISSGVQPRLSVTLYRKRSAEVAVPTLLALRCRSITRWAW